jgi:hypothetical protein
MAQHSPGSTAPFFAGFALALILSLAAPPRPAQAEALAGAASSPVTAQSYKLPISPPLDQGDSGLCWVYATLSMLESNYLAKHPGSKIALSRAALQRFTIMDRFQREITGNSTHLEDGGLAVDALLLIRQNGLVGARDYHDIVDSDAVFAGVSSRLAPVKGADAKLKALDVALARALGAAPASTRLDGRTLTAAGLAKTVLGDEVWTEYDVIRDGGAPRVALSDDPDARPETLVHNVELAQAVKLIHDSLARGEAVVWGSTDNHALLIYGADYDAEGQPLAYWIKDSFAPYTKRMPAGEVHAVLTDVTVAAPADANLTAQRD